MAEDMEYLVKRWEALYRAADECTACPLYAMATSKVIADPPLFNGRRRILFVGEAPGEEEDRRGIPFVGKSGQFLRSQITRIDLPENLWAVTNTVQCRPPGNRDPEEAEQSACLKFLVQKIRMLDPSVIVPLGKPACCVVFDLKMFSMLNRACAEMVTRIRAGQVRISIPAFPMPHPRWGIQNPKQYEIMFDRFKRWLVSRGVLGKDL
jgi:uracil-DNA glycosylase family 4